jgi:arylsulfatase A-like enzyme
MTAHDLKMKDTTKPPNLLFVFGDQWRAQAFGYKGDTNVQTPRIDRFAAESLSMANTVSNVPICCPWRASMLSGQYPLTHGIIVNDQMIKSNPVGFGTALKDAGYHTGYIGKWHIDGQGRRAFVPPERRLGFEFWRGFECTHEYNDSNYYADTPEMLHWEGYDAIDQTKMACGHLQERAKTDQPFALFISWGPPHDPYDSAPEKYRKMYDPAKIQLRPNVPAAAHRHAQEMLAGYYAHCTALDDCFGTLLDELARLGLDDNTIVVFTSDHGDMLGSHGHKNKQHPYDESVHVPFLLRWPAAPGMKPRTETALFSTPDIMPTLLGLCGAAIPATVEGVDFSPMLRGECRVDAGPAYLALYRPHHQLRYSDFGRDYRGIRTERHTYVRDHKGPWLLFDNHEDPYQFRNLVGYPSAQALLAELDTLLDHVLARRGDDFETGEELCRRYDVALNSEGEPAFGQWKPAREEISLISGTK